MCSITLHQGHVSEIGLLFAGSDIDPFLKILVTRACFHYIGTILAVLDFLHKKVSAGANSRATVLNSLGGSLSDPHAFVGFRDKSRFSTPAVLILRAGISGNGDFPLSETFIFLSWVNTDKNCSFNVSAFSLHVINSFVCTLFRLNVTKN